MRTFALITLSVALGFTASGCSRIKDLKGYVVDTEKVALVTAGTDNKASVQKTLGRPTMVSEFDAKTWYYVSRSTEQLAFLRPKPKDQQIIVVRFDDKGNVTKIEKLGLEQIANVDPSGDKTPTRGKDISALEQILGNVGRFSPAGAGGGGGGGPQ
jgi:outer membrane protein assembly factor BamE (lipoprotein component of BamABCDE complex)